MESIEDAILEALTQDTMSIRGLSDALGATEKKVWRAITRLEAYRLITPLSQKFSEPAPSDGKNGGLRGYRVAFYRRRASWENEPTRLAA
ncbi:MAG: Lrp/AsnC family transcriptional regulator [Bradyrhizobium sp.]|nr:Lrp/AsnC family transcriptional regulator [Bradyrhizobium sp.]